MGALSPGRCVCSCCVSGTPTEVGARRKEGKYGCSSVSHHMDAGVWPGKINLEWCAWEVYGEEG